MHNLSLITGNARHVPLKYAHTYLQINEFISLFHLLLFFPVNQQAKQIVSWSVVKFPLIYETYRLIIMFTRVCCWSLSAALQQIVVTSNLLNSFLNVPLWSSHSFSCNFCVLPTVCRDHSIPDCCTGNILVTFSSF